ncbi:ribose-phosphate pyrophosphokinase [Candidiatus Paracoxiella cheracis]|uniref:ribose-phosphate pyrophosphokinase n=1 Tax=Candidiatus Paracoxiella cheracis TaxID=3405120 RepID=UPI003BF56427
MANHDDVRIFHGNANPELATKVAAELKTTLGKAYVGRFSDGEIRIEIEENVRGRDIYVIQSTCDPVNDNLMELLMMGDAFRRASANSITAVVPYFGYARQDRRVRSSRVPISAKVVADMMQKVGFTRLITVDLHADQIQGFFYMPVDNIYASITVLEGYNLLDKMPNPLIVSPDVGGVVRARAIARRLNDSDLAIIDKRRPGPNQAEVMNVIGNVEGRHCMIVDDIVDTAGTLCSAATALKQKGAETVSAYCTHPVFSGHAIENITKSDIDEILVSDTIPLTPAAQESGKIKQITLSTLIAETISRVNLKESVSSMFVD